MGLNSSSRIIIQVLAPEILSTLINILILYQNNFWNIFIKPRAASELFVFLKNFYKSEFPAENAKKHHVATLWIINLNGTE